MTQTAQERLANARVVLLGLDGSGCACATYLVSAGIGELILIDQTLVRTEDLVDQPLFSADDIDAPKIAAAKTRLEEIDSKVKVRTLSQSIDSHNAEELIDDAHIVIDGLSDWQDKLLLSDVCMQLGKPLVHAGVRGFEFQVYTMIPGRSACLRCVFSKTGLEDVSSSWQSQQGTLGPLCGMAGAFQSIEAIKILSGLGPTPGSHLIKFDSLRRDFDDVTDLGPRPDCPDCGKRF